MRSRRFAPPRGNATRTASPAASGLTRRAALLALVVGALAGACRSKPTPTPPPPAGVRVGAALAAALDAADRVRAPWLCMRKTAPGLAAEALALQHSWQLADHTVTLVDGSASAPLAIAVFADAGNADPTTIAALGRLRGQLGEVDLAIALGGMGTTAIELEATLGALADHATYPVIALPGDLESASGLAAAVQALRARGAPVIDGRLVRRIDLPMASIATVSGAAFATRLAAHGDGCVFGARDATTAIESIGAAPGLRILASTEAPRVVSHGDAAGDLVVTASPEGSTMGPGFGASRIDLALHFPIEPLPSPARDGTRDGSATSLSPGTADASVRLPGGLGTPTAGILTLANGTWKWRPISSELRSR